MRERALRLRFAMGMEQTCTIDSYDGRLIAEARKFAARNPFSETPAICSQSLIKRPANGITYNRYNGLNRKKIVYTKVTERSAFEAIRFRTPRRRNRANAARKRLYF